MFDLASYVNMTYPSRDEHPVYAKSMFWGVAPEYATGEVLVGGAYREFVIDAQDKDIDLTKIKAIPELPALASLAPAERNALRELLTSTGGLASPAPAGRRSRTGAEQGQLMPLVPEIARHANVLGGVRNRWRPGALVAQTLAAGTTPAEWAPVTDAFRDALKVGPHDDIFARYVESTLRMLPGGAAPAIGQRPAAAWRQPTPLLTPSEQLVRDLKRVIAIKGDLTRRQWIALLESALRVGLGAHLLWLMRLNWNVWSFLADIVDDGRVPIRSEVDALWEMHHADPLLEVGAEASPQIRSAIQRFVQARLGINVVLRLLVAAGCDWTAAIGGPAGKDSREELYSFLAHVEANRGSVGAAAGQVLGPSLREAVSRAIDRRPSLQGIRSGFSKNIMEYLRYSLGQLQPNDPDLVEYDQAYILAQGAARRGLGRVELGPTQLIYLTFAASPVGGGHLSIDAFREYLRAHGIHAPAGELSGGPTMLNLERLGLTIESPDAGGGRMLVSPLRAGASGSV